VACAWGRFCEVASQREPCSSLRIAYPFLEKEGRKNLLPLLSEEGCHLVSGWWESSWIRSGIRREYGQYGIEELLERWPA